MAKNKQNKTHYIVYHDKGFNKILGGCDEAGRGPLAGPVVCAACVMPLDNIIDGINDSKTLSEKKREYLYEKIIQIAKEYSVEVIDHKTVDEINILNATKLGMVRAINRLNSPNLILVDAVRVEANFEVIPIIKGDAKSYNIAAASIIAKVTRDRIMREMDKTYPGYYFYKNKGYGTKQHIESLKKMGICDLHRLSYLKNFFDKLPNKNKKEIDT